MPENGSTDLYLYQHAWRITILWAPSTYRKIVENCQYRITSLCTGDNIIPWYCLGEITLMQIFRLSYDTMSQNSNPILFKSTVTSQCWPQKFVNVIFKDQLVNNLQTLRKSNQCLLLSPTLSSSSILVLSLYYVKAGLCLSVKKWTLKDDHDATKFRSES